MQAEQRTTQENHFRAYNSTLDDSQQAVNKLKQALELLNEAAEKAPHKATTIETARGMIQETSQDINNQIPQLHGRMAGAKHEMKTADQDRYENRPAPEDFQ